MVSLYHLVKSKDLRGVHRGEGVRGVPPPLELKIFQIIQGFPGASPRNPHIFQNLASWPPLTVSCTRPGSVLLVKNYNRFTLSGTDVFSNRISLPIACKRCAIKILTTLTDHNNDLESIGYHRNCYHRFYTGNLHRLSDDTERDVPTSRKHHSLHIKSSVGIAGPIFPPECISPVPIGP